MDDDTIAINNIFAKFNQIERGEKVQLDSGPSQERMNKMAMEDTLSAFYGIAGRALANGGIVEEETYSSHQDDKALVTETKKKIGLTHKYKDQVKGKQKAPKAIKVIGTNKDPDHPFKGKLVGDSINKEEPALSEAAQNKVDNVVINLVKKGFHEDLSRAVARKMVMERLTFTNAVNSVFLGK